MPSAATTITVHPLRFGRKPVMCAVERGSGTMGRDLRLFAITYAAGFLFVTIFLA